MRKPILVLLLLSVELFGAQGGTRPNFRDYPVKTIYRGTPAAPKLVSKEQKLFRTMIRLGARSKVQFAGHYTLPMWGCGSACTEFAIADSVSGRVYDGLFATDFPLACLNDQDDSSSERVEFRPDSRLLKINGCPEERDCGFYDYEMVDGKGLRLVRTELLPKKCQP